MEVENPSLNGGLAYILWFISLGVIPFSTLIGKGLLGLPECFPFDSIKAYLMKPPVLMSPNGEKRSDPKKAGIGIVFLTPEKPLSTTPLLWQKNASITRLSCCGKIVRDR